MRVPVLNAFGVRLVARPSRHPARAVLVLAAVLGLVAAGCARSGPGLEIDPLDALTPSQRNVVATAEAWLDEEGDVVLDAGDDLRFVRLDDGPGVSHVAFGHVVRDHLVLGSELVVHVLADGTVQGTTDSLTSARPTGPDEADVEASTAEETATKSFDREGAPVGSAELVWHIAGSSLQLVWRIQVSLDDPPEAWEVLVDATTGEVVQAADLITTHQAAGRDACPVPSAPSACVFVPDPLSAAAGEPVTVDDANRFLDGVTLEGLDDPSSGRLVGEYVDVDDAGDPERVAPEADGTWAVGRGQAGFEHVMAYYWIDRAQRLIQRLGITDVRNGPIVVYPLERDYLDNAHYDPVSQRLEFGVSSSTGTAFAEDAQVILHEYGHALLGAQAPGLDAVAALGDGAAYHEAFGDLFSYLVTLSDRTGVGEFDDGCLGAWGFGQCIRRLDTDNVVPEDKAYEEHLDAMIYSGAVHDVLVALLDDRGLAIEDCFDGTACDEVRDRVLVTLLQSNGYIGSYVSFDQLAAGYLLANDALYGGADRDTIATAFSDHGINPGGTPANAVAVNLEIQHDNRSELAVFAGVQDASGDDLCAPIRVWEPSVQRGYQVLRGRFDVTGTECAALGPPSAGQRWYVRVADTVPQQETGGVLAVSVSYGSEQYTVPAGIYIPDGDEQGVTFLIDGSGEVIAPPVDPVDPDTDVFASFSITHPYVGDLLVRGGVVGPDRTVTCSVTALQPTPGLVGSGGVEGDINLSPCDGDYPPSADAVWFVQVADLGAADLGTLDVLTLTGPDGQVRRVRASDLPGEIPDADPEGIVYTWDR